MKPYYQNDLTTIYNGDCLEVMNGLDDNSINAILTDPPYLIDYKTNYRKYDGFNFNWKKTIDKLYNIIVDGGIVVWIVNDQTQNGS
ncbi:MAG: hypothetical protein PF487_11770, partial [Bacteroidales bacterium]|nr:hypothetical protein [Bacteroidales bacterium]